MEELFIALDQNLNLTDEVKNGLKDILSVFIEKYPNIDKDYVKGRLKSLQIECLPRFGEYEDVRSLNGKVLVDKNTELPSDVLCAQILLKGLFPNSNSKLEALYNGTTEMISNTLVGNEYWSDEYLTCTLLDFVLDTESKESTLVNHYLNGSFPIIVPMIEDKMGRKEANEFLSECNQNYMLKKKQTTSLLPEIQMHLVETFFNYKPSLNAVLDFSSLVILNPLMFEDKANLYDRLDILAEFYDNISADYMRTLQEERSRTI